MLRTYGGRDRVILYRYTPHAVTNVSIGLDLNETTVNEGEDVHFDVCLTINGDVEVIENSFYVEFDLCAIGLNLSGNNYCFSYKICMTRIVC